VTTPTEPPGRPARYEVVVRGRVSPALRGQLRPAVARRTEAETVLRAHTRPGWELADLVSALRARGLQVVSITVLA
jgi:hypothetical protein